MKTSTEHLPPVKQHELRRAVQIILDEFEDVLKEASASNRKRGRILKIILFGSYARGTFVDEHHTGKGYRSDFDLLVIVNNKQFANFSTYETRIADRLLRDRGVSTPASPIVHSLREVNAALRQGRGFFVDIRREGIVVYELDHEPLAQPGQISREEAWRLASNYYRDRLPAVLSFLDTAEFLLSKRRNKHACFELHQSIEQAYSLLLLVKTNYSPPSHNVRFLRRMAERQAPKLIHAWPELQQRHVSWFNIVNTAYVKARYSEHFDIDNEALTWLIERSIVLIEIVQAECEAHIAELAHARRV